MKTIANTTLPVWRGSVQHHKKFKFILCKRTEGKQASLSIISKFFTSKFIIVDLLSFVYNFSSNTFCINRMSIFIRQSNLSSQRPKSQDIYLKMAVNTIPTLTTTNKALVLEKFWVSYTSLKISYHMPYILFSSVLLFFKSFFFPQLTCHFFLLILMWIFFPKIK